MFFRGRENAHRELGFEVMNRVLKACTDLSQVDMPPRLIGNSIVMVLSPRSGKPVSSDRVVAKPLSVSKPVTTAMPPAAVKPVEAPPAPVPPVAPIVPPAE